MARLHLPILGLFLLAALACAPSPSSDSPPPNLVVISADSLRADRLRLWNRQGVETPHLDRLAARGALYRNAWAVAPWTAPSMVSLFTGLYPPSHGVVYRDDTTPPDLPTLPRILEHHGYRLGNFTFFSEISYFRNLGLPPRAPGLLAHGRETEAFRRWLDALESDVPFFAWIHLLEPHLPYGATGYRATAVRIPGSSGLERSQLQATVPVGSVRFEAGDRDRLLDLYDRDIAAMDRSVGKILAALESGARLNETIVLFVADHGEELLDHGWVGHASTSLEAKLRPALLHIPLVLAGPGIDPGTVSDELVQQVDVLPTLLRLVDVSPPTPLDGIPLPRVTDRTRDFFATVADTLLGRGARHDRELAFFDSSPGGNLTPLERVGERLQGVTDAHCLLVSRLAPESSPRTSLYSLAGDGADCDARREDLAAALGAWRQSQGEQRVALLRTTTRERGPGKEAEAWPESIEIASPRPLEQLRWAPSGGQITLAWQGDDSSSFWIEYRIGRPPTAVEGRFRVEQSRLVFGPFPRGFWNDVASYSPFRFRILDPAAEQRSAWVEFRVRTSG